jgi:hypothetical protein
MKTTEKENQLLEASLTECPDGTYSVRFWFDDIELMQQFTTRHEAKAWFLEMNRQFY